MKGSVLRFRASMEGLSTEEIALIVVTGLVLGTFPVFGCPTVFCLAAALRLRLSVVALQLINQVSSPLQIALLLPLAHAGSRIFGPLPLSATLLSQGGGLMLHAVEGWFCLCLPLGFVVYSTLICTLRHRREEEAVECPAR